jgi:hypothetical protein
LTSLACELPFAFHFISDVLIFSLQIRIKQNAKEAKLAFVFILVLPLGLRLEAKATNKNEMKFCLGPFALVLHAYAAAATYAKARLGLGQVTSGGSKCSKSNKNTKCNRGQEECE